MDGCDGRGSRRRTLRSGSACAKSRGLSLSAPCLGRRASAGRPAPTAGGARAQADALSLLEPVAIRSLSDEDRTALLTSQRISPALAFGTEPERWALLDNAGDLSLLLNEEDHLRLQCIVAGSGVRAAAERALASLAALRCELKFATDTRWGALTSSLGNLGTGMRVSVLVHLPAMSIRRHLGDELAVAHRPRCRRSRTPRGRLGDLGRPVSDQQSHLVRSHRARAN